MSIIIKITHKRIFYLFVWKIKLYSSFGSICNFLTHISNKYICTYISVQDVPRGYFKILSYWGSNKGWNVVYLGHVDFELYLQWKTYEQIFSHYFHFDLSMGILLFVIFLENNFYCFKNFFWKEFFCLNFTLYLVKSYGRVLFSSWES